MSDWRRLAGPVAALLAVGGLIAVLVYPHADRAVTQAHLRSEVKPLKAAVDRGLLPKLDADGKGHPPVATSRFAACQTPSGRAGRMAMYEYSFPLLVLGRQTKAIGYINAAKHFVSHAATAWRAQGYTVRRIDATGLRNTRRELIAPIYQATAVKGSEHLRAVADFSDASITMAGYGSCPAD